MEDRVYIYIYNFFFQFNRLTRFKFIVDFIIHYTLMKHAEIYSFLFPILYTRTYLYDFYFVIYDPSSANLPVRNSFSPYQFHSCTSWTSMGCCLPPEQSFLAARERRKTNRGVAIGVGGRDPDDLCRCRGDFFEG